MDPLKLELQKTVTCLGWVLGVELRSSAKTIHILQHFPVAISPHFVLKQAPGLIYKPSAQLPKQLGSQARTSCFYPPSAGSTVSSTMCGKCSYLLENTPRPSPLVHISPQASSPSRSFQHPVWFLCIQCQQVENDCSFLTYREYTCTACLRMLGDNVQVMVLSCHHVDPGAQTPVISTFTH